MVAVCLAKKAQGVPGLSPMLSQTTNHTKLADRQLRYDRSAHRNEFLRTEVTGSAPADGISISVKCHWLTRPVTAGASDGRRNCIARVGRVAGLNGVSRAVRIGYGTAHDGARHHTSSDADTDSATPTARFGWRRCQQGNCNRRGSSKCEQGLVHGRLLISRWSRPPPVAPRPKINLASEFE